MNLHEKANEIIEYLQTQDQIKKCTLYGSLVNSNIDKYSDIDIEVNVGNYDHSEFIKKIPNIMKEKYSVIYSDYAKSLIPESYIVSIAIDESNPFCIIDIKCTSSNVKPKLRKEHFVNNKVDHIIKLWVANFKHYVRGFDCHKDIKRMSKRVIQENLMQQLSDKEMLKQTLKWLVNNCESKHTKYIESCKKAFNCIAR